LVKISRSGLSLHTAAKPWDIGWLREIFAICLEKSKSTFAFRAVTLFKNKNMARENYCHFVNGEQDFLEPP
jgi:hypothetical protein